MPGSAYDGLGRSHTSEINLFWLRNFLSIDRNLQENLSLRFSSGGRLSVTSKPRRYSFRLWGLWTAIRFRQSFTARTRRCC